MEGLERPASGEGPRVTDAPMRDGVVLLTFDAHQCAVSAHALAAACRALQGSSAHAEIDCAALLAQHPCFQGVHETDCVRGVRLFGALCEAVHVRHAPVPALPSTEAERDVCLALCTLLRANGVRVLLCSQLGSKPLL